MKEPETLTDSLGELARRSPQAAGPATEQALLKQFRQFRRRRYGWAYGLCAIAASLIAALALSVLRPGVRTNASPPGGGGEFIALPYAQSGVPLEQPVVVRMNVPLSDLDVPGLPLESGQTDRRVEAEFLVGQDGVPRAVRFIK